MNAHDVVVLREAPPVPAEAVAVKTRYDDLSWFLEYAGTKLSDRYGRLTQGGEIVQIRDREIEGINLVRRDMVLKYGTLGDLEVPPQSDRLDVWGCLSRTPKANASSIRDLCDALGFIIIPFEYLDQRSYANERSDMQRRIQRFAAIEGFQAYVLCPVAHYSLDRHVRSKDPNLQMYVGRHTQAFMAAQMTIPSLRTIIVDLEAVKAQIKGFDARMESAEQNMQMLARLLQELQNQVQEQQRQIALQRAREKALRAQVAALEASQFMALEPMMFIMRKGTNMTTGSETAFVGPCWGPDFEDIVFTAIGLAKRGDQREQITDIVAKTW